MRHFRGWQNASIRKSCKRIKWRIGALDLCSSSDMHELILIDLMQSRINRCKKRKHSHFAGLIAKGAQFLSPQSKTMIAWGSKQRKSGPVSMQRSLNASGYLAWMPGTWTVLDADPIADYLLDAQAARLESAAGIKASSHVQAALISSRAICLMPFTPLKFTIAQKKISNGCGWCDNNMKISLSISKRSR